MNDGFEPTTTAAWQRLRAVDPTRYARSRNALDGAVTRLSPYITHGLLRVPDAIAWLQTEHRLPAQHKLVFELGWREYFRHVWRHRGEGILHSLHAGPLPEAAYARAMPDDVLEGRTGLAVIDRAVHALATEGWLHNHARMWLASYLVHLRKVHWRVGADWMIGQLLDGDLASNHLSWQWVAGTASVKPYLFNAENVRRYAPPGWHVDGTALECSYEDLDALARSAEVVAPAPPPLLGMAVPPRFAEPPGARFTRASADDVAGRDVWLMHPWALDDPPPGVCVVAVCDAAFHRRWPWSGARWRFVVERMEAVADHAWIDEAAAIAQALAAARSVSGIDDPHRAGSAPGLGPEPAGFTEPGRACASFSSWWSRVRLRTDRAA